MNCSQTRKLLSAYVDGELFGREAAAVAAHVEACPSCQLEFHDLTIVKDMLTRLPQLPAPANLHAGVMARLQAISAQAADGRADQVADRLPASSRAPRRSATVIRFGWKAGVAAAAVAAFAFAWGLGLQPPEVPLVADGGQQDVPSTPAQQQPVPQPTVAEPSSKPDETPGTDAEPAEPNEQTPGSTVIAYEPGESPSGPPPVSEPAVGPDAGQASEPDPGAGNDDPALPPEFADSRVGTANTQAPVSDRLVAKKMQVSLVALDREAFVQGIAELTEAYGVEWEHGEEGIIRVLVPQQDERAMELITAIRDLGVADTFKYDQLSETDLTEAVRNLAAYRDYMANELIAGNDSVQADLLLTEARLADYFREVEYLTLEITVKGLGD